MPKTSQEDYDEDYGAFDENKEDEEDEEEVAEDEPPKRDGRAVARGLMEQSGLTDNDRRQLRKKQRDLLKEMEDRDRLDVKQARSRNNELYEKVCYTREAVLDGENLIVFASKASQQVDSLVDAPRYDADRLATKLVQKCRSSAGDGSAYFDWHALGIEAGICFNSIPSHVSFLNGPLTDERQLQARQKKARQQRQLDEEAEEQKPEDVQGNTKRDADQLSAVEQSMKHLAKTLKKRVDETYKKNKRELQHKLQSEEIPEPLKKKLKKQGSEVCAIQYLFNPQSFTQTVENIFHFSFLIQKASATISVRDRKQLAEVDGEPMFCKAGPVVKYAMESKTNNPPPRQAIATLTMKDWREMCKAYEVTKGDLPHRTGSRFAAAKHSEEMSESE